MPDDIAERLRALERTVTDSDTPVRDLSDAAAVHERLDALEADLATVTERVDAIDATVQSLHGYVGELEAVNDRVERRADAARAAVERLEDEREPSPGGSPRATGANVDAASDGLGTAASTDGESLVDTRNADDSDTLLGDGGDGDDSNTLMDRLRESL